MTKLAILAIVLIVLVTACCPEGSTYHATYQSKYGMYNGNGYGCSCPGPGVKEALFNDARLIGCYVTKP